ncbi:MAG: hypothetical protein Tsb006_5650 [Rickettsiaceae bacterium]
MIAGGSCVTVKARWSKFGTNLKWTIPIYKMRSKDYSDLGWVSIIIGATSEAYIVLCEKRSQNQRSCRVQG